MKRNREIMEEPSIDGEKCAICGKPITFTEKYVWSKDKKKRTVFVHQKCLDNQGKQKKEDCT